MGYFLFSEDWVEECIKEMKKGPDPERKKSIHSNYWKWVEQCKRKMDIRLALVLKDDEHGSSFAYFVLKQGEVEDGYLGKADERGTANFVLAANREDWKEILEGPRDITQNIINVSKNQSCSRKLAFLFSKHLFFCRIAEMHDESSNTISSRKRTFLIMKSWHVNRLLRISFISQSELT